MLGLKLNHVSKRGHWCVLLWFGTCRFPHFLQGDLTDTCEHDCPISSEAVLKDMGKLTSWVQKKRWYKRKPCVYFIGLLPDTQNYGLRMHRKCRERFLRHWLQRKLLDSDPGMHHGTCITHVPWCMSGSLTRVGGENVSGIPGACATRHFAYLVRGPWDILVSHCVWNMTILDILSYILCHSVMWSKLEFQRH